MPGAASYTQVWKLEAMLRSKYGWPESHISLHQWLKFCFKYDLIEISSDHYVRTVLSADFMWSCEGNTMSENHGDMLAMLSPGIWAYHKDKPIHMNLSCSEHLVKLCMEVVGQRAPREHPRNQDWGPGGSLSGLGAPHLGSTDGPDWPQVLRGH